jgi:PhzF family phenazine biosynthesis protein
MSSRHAFAQIDVFTTEPFAGNAAAVVLDADDLAPATMQTIAREMNLSETVFLLRPDRAGADYRARIFTPSSELPFAGHPTIAAAHAHVTREVAAGRVAPATLRQECGIGIVPVERRERDGRSFLVMTQGRPERRPVEIAMAERAALLRCDAASLPDLPVEIVSTGIPWVVLPVGDPQAVAGMTPDLAAIGACCSRWNAVGLAAFAPRGLVPGTHLKLRCFAPGEAVAEDPVTGSANGCVAAYVAAHGLLGRGRELVYWAEQGAEVHRPGRVYLECSRTGKGDEWLIRVGGHAVTVMDGTILA